MAALAVGNPNLVALRVDKALANANPAAAAAFRQLKLYLANQKGNPNLAIYPFTEAQADASGGTVMFSGAAKLYGFYVKKLASTTDNWVAVYDDATDDTTAGNERFRLPLLASAEECFYINPAGLDLVTGVVVTQYTTGLGTSDGSDGGDGFFIVGNP